MPEMLKSGIYTSEQVGLVSSLFFFTYGAGQIVNGYLGDKIRPQYLLFAGLTGSGLCNLLAGFMSETTGLSLFWAMNGLFQSMLWPPVIYIMSAYYDKTEKNLFAKYFTVSVPLGTLLCYGSSLLWIYLFNWRYVFYMSGIIIFVLAVIWIFSSNKLLKNLKKNVADSSQGKEEENTDATELTEEKAKLSENKKGKNREFFSSLLFSGMIFMLLPIAIHGALKDSVTNWVPSFVSEYFDTSTSLALTLTMVLPVINVLGGFVAAWLQGRLKNEALCSGIFFIFSTVVTLTLFFFAKYSLILSVTGLALLTSTMFAINLLTITLMPLRFAKFNKVSFVSGVLNSLAYFGCALVNVFVGLLLNAFSWSGVMLLWVGLSGFACAVSLLCVGMWRKFIKNDN